MCICKEKDFQAYISHLKLHREAKKAAHNKTSADVQISHNSEPNTQFWNWIS